MARNFCGGLFLRIGDFLSFARINFAIRTDWFFSLGINFCDFQKVPWYPALMMFPFFVKYVQYK